MVDILVDIVKSQLLNMDVTELHNEENLLVQMQDRWERSQQMGTTQKAVQKQLGNHGVSKFALDIEYQ